MNTVKVIAHQIYNPKGANCIIKVKLINGAEKKVTYKPSEMSHFNAACSMLQSRDVYFVESRNAFISQESNNESTFEIDFE